MKKLEKITKAFGNISRLKILQFLKRRKEASVIEISGGTQCSYKATSKHLSILFRVDIVDREQRGYEMQYRLSDTLDPAAKMLITFL